MLAPDGADEVVEQIAGACSGRAATGGTASWPNGHSGTTAEVFAAAARETGLDVDAALHDAALEAHLDAWTPHTITDPEAAPLLPALRERGIRIGLLSNTHWPRRWHEHWLERDGVLGLIDVRVYTSDLQHMKPHPEAFRAVLAELGASADRWCSSATGRWTTSAEQRLWGCARCSWRTPTYLVILLLQMPESTAYRRCYPLLINGVENRLRSTCASALAQTALTRQHEPT